MTVQEIYQRVEESGGEAKFTYGEIHEAVKELGAECPYGGVIVKANRERGGYDWFERPQ